MTIKDFKLEEWLKDKNQKVVCGYGWPVDIIGTDFAHRTDGKEYPILAVIHNNTEGYENDYTHFYDADGLYDPENKKMYNVNHNLKIVLDEPGLTEFEEKVSELVEYVCAHPQIKGNNSMIKALAKDISFSPTFDSNGELNLLSIYHKGLEDGKKETANECPSWIKCGFKTSPKETKGSYEIFDDILYRDGYYIFLSDLWEKLEKGSKNGRRYFS